jgi:hypothetical protein
VFIASNKEGRNGDEQARAEDGFLATLGAPARRALEREGLTTLAKLSDRTEKLILALHGMGPSTIPKLKKALEAAGLAFRT